jgi:hypothetical protein
MVRAGRWAEHWSWPTVLVDYLLPEGEPAMAVKRRILLLYCVVGAATALLIVACALLTTSSAGLGSAVR